MGGTTLEREATAAPALPPDGPAPYPPRPPNSPALVLAALEQISTSPGRTS
ncbi:hypothetical protein [Streptomyces sp. NPDC018693]|uniref:hypothetical protein n=1 Tax=unclassified Streptomyces TaxID=2593676 RepID=UPI0037A59C8D